MVLGFIAVYVVFQLGVGYLVSRRIRSEEDYLVAGRSLGPALATASVFATWFGAETCVGAAGEVYERGLAGVSGDPFGYGICLIVFGLLVAGPLWRARVTTIADLYRARFSSGVERTVALLMVPGSVLWAAAQIRAFGTVVASASELVTVEQGLVAAAVVTVLYTSLGGLLADAWTDLVQGGVLLLCLVVLGAVAFSAPGAPSSALAAARSAQEEVGVLARIDAWLVPILGSLFAQELAARAAAARSGRLAVRASVGAGGLYLLAGLFPVGLGLLARAQLPGLEHGEAALPTLAGRYLGLVGQGIFAGALVSAILSTIDSALLAASGLVTHNLLPALRRRGSEAMELLTARLGVLALGGLAWALARSADSVHGLVEEASAFGSAGFVVTGFGVLFGERGGAGVAYATLGAGAAAYVFAAHVFEIDAAFTLSLLAAFLTWLLGLLLGPRWSRAAGQ